MILAQEIIRKKRDGHSLSQEELTSFFTGFLRGDVADYQVSAMLMAIILKGMSEDETVTLTRLARDSGDVFDWGFPRHLLVDKHSTGGIGDKTSLIILPLCISEGLKVPMMAGRGLGHTGGTLDKLEAIGMNVFLNPAAARAQMERFGGVFMGQTERVVPLDRRLYALRDVTATVESIPLIISSILSKKLAEGVGGLVMDVKFGSGAFMRELGDARQLAHGLQSVGQACGLAVRYLLTDMNSPLGAYAGNTLEVYESLEVLRGRGPRDTRELSLDLAAEMVCLAFPDRRYEDVKVALATKLDDGSAAQIFRDVAIAQGADPRFLDEPERLLGAKIKRVVKTQRAGYVDAIDVRLLGLAVIELGGGRRLVTDTISPFTGLSGLKRCGTWFEKGEPLCIVHGETEAAVEKAAAMISNAYHLSDTQRDDVLIQERG